MTEYNLTPSEPEPKPERGLNADLLQLQSTMYHVLLDLQRALVPVFAKWEDEIPLVVQELSEVIDIELGRRNEIRQRQVFERAAFDAAASDDAGKG